MLLSVLTLTLSSQCHDLCYPLPILLVTDSASPSLICASPSLICALHHRSSLFVRNVPARLRLHLSDFVVLFHLLCSFIFGVVDLWICSLGFCSLDLWICSLGFCSLDLWICSLSCRSVDFVLQDSNVYLIFVFRSKSKPTAAHSSPIRLNPWLFAVGGGSGTSPPDLIELVAGWAQTRPRPTCGQP